MTEINQKLHKLRSLMNEKKLEGILITRNDNFSWITAGGRGWVARNAESSVAWILVTADEAFLVSNNIESKRLVEEENCSHFKLLEYKWYEDPMELVRKVAKGELGADRKISGFMDVSAHIKTLRMELTEWETEKVRKMGREIEGIFERTLLNASPDMSERELASVLMKEFSYEGYELPVVLIFSMHRRSKYRHNLPSGERLGEFFFASICAQKYGLVLSTTRSLAFGKIDEEILRQHEINAAIEAEIMHQTVPGKTLADMFYIIKGIYEKRGLGREFFKHHQGGIAGYNTREEKAMPDSKTVIRENHIIAWNPTITGTKVEDTFLVMEKPRSLTFTEDSQWPSLKFEIEGTEYRIPGINVL